MIFINMKPLDHKTLFSIFEAGDEEIYKEHGIADTLKNPFVLMGMVMRGIENYHIMDLMYKRAYPEEYSKVREGVKYKFMNKLFGYLKRIDGTKFETVYTIGESFDSKAVDKCLNYLLDFYQDIEEYEKCAVIKKYIDLLTEKQIERLVN